MNQKDLIKTMKHHLKVVKSIITSLQKIDKLESNSENKLESLRKEAKKLNKLSMDFVPFPWDDFVKWVEQFETDLKQREKQLQKQFGVKLEQELQPLGIYLRGHYPELKAWLFTIEVDFDKWKATLWYGPKQEKLNTVPLSIPHLVKQIEVTKKSLELGIPEQELLEKLYKAYTRVVPQIGQDVPIIEVLKEMSYLLQDKKFYQDPRKEYYKSYTRFNFSFDLFRLRRFQSQTSPSKQFRLRVATRSLTKHRSNFLWIPKNASGEGDVYSHLKFEEK